MGVQEVVDIFLKICGAVGIVGGAVAVLWKWIRPAVKLTQRVTELEECVKRDYEEIASIKELLAVLCKCQVVMIDSQLTGDNVDALQQAKSEMIEALSESRTR